MAVPIIPILGLAGDLIKRLFPDPEQRAKAELALADLHQKGELTELQSSMAAILAEANSVDPWVSRARPTFLYTIYAIILSALPMGALHAYSPETATAVAAGFKAWLAAIPEPMWGLFGAGYLGYAGFRSWDKKNGTTQ